MLNELINRPKTKAGQYQYKNDTKVVKERLTSYGSSAILRMNNYYIIVYWDSEAKVYALSYCGTNVSMLNRMWNEIV